MPTVYALYSPLLNKEAATIKKHIFDNRKAHGTGGWMDVLDRAESDAKKGTDSKINKGLQQTYWTAVKEMVSDSLTDNFWDGLSLLWKSWINSDVTKKGISNCLRDDIWELQALKEQVLNEIMKASMMGDYTRSGQLWLDYQFLELRISGIVKGENFDWDGDGESEVLINLKHNSDNSSFWFPNSQNFYVDCPYGDFTQAWEDLKRAFDSFKAIGKGSIEIGSFGVMVEVAKKRADKRAQQWIKANQITLTIGGKEGSSPRSLVNGPGLAGLAADLKTEMSFVAGYAELVFVNTWKAVVGIKDMAVGSGKLLLNTVNIGDYATAYQNAYDAKHLAEKQMKTAIKFNLSLNNVAENSLVAIDEILFKTNGVIEDAVSKKVAKQNLKTFYDKFMVLTKTQCK